ncbi:MAG: hypothetical protein BAA03_07050 [Caldibacillus debilis]|nr:MAG: hypothetical protein BAA03_07050 [Caldibacillus debilis]
MIGGPGRGGKRQSAAPFSDLTANGRRMGKAGRSPAGFRGKCFLPIKPFAEAFPLRVPTEPLSGTNRPSPFRRKNAFRPASLTGGSAADKFREKRKLPF